MARGTSKLAAAAFALCLLLLIGIGFAAAYRVRPPAPLGADAPAQQFSAARARSELVHLLGGETPHPIGSAANKLVKARLVKRLEQLGLKVQVQNTFGCSATYAVCGPVENVLARIPGERDSAVLVMAHYDSVNYAPGAGDDGAGVAAALEVARILQGQGQHENTFLFAFTDGEEAGLLGAEAFFAEHPWAKHVGVAVNLEGRGSSGPVLLTRVGPMSGNALDVFRAVAPHPFAASAAEEVMKRMPNDTDLSVASAAGIPGLDFAFIGTASDYHTPLDTIANLEPGSLQHHGDNVLPLVQALADVNLSARAPNYVYANITSALWLAYSPATGRVLAILAFVLLAVATWRRWQGLAQFSGACGVVILALVAISALEAGGFALADRISGTRVAWPAQPWPWRLLLYGIPVFVLALLRPLVHRIGFWNTWFAPWWLWSLLVLAQAWYAPLATHLMLPAVLAAGGMTTLLAFSQRLDRPAIRCGAATVNVLIAGFFLLPLVYTGEVVQGWTFAPTLFVPLALLAITLLPLLDRGRVLVSLSAALFAVIAGLTWMHWAPLYSPERPQQLNFVYTLDADADRATYSARSPNPLPKAVHDAMPFTLLVSPLPWEHTTSAVAPAEAVYRSAATIEKLPAAGKTRSYLVRPGASTNRLGIVMDKRQPISAIRVDGHPVDLDPRRSDDFRWAYVVAPPPDGVRIDVDVDGDAPINAYFVDRSVGLPPSGQVLVDARGALATPVHQGDIWEVFQRVKL